jgi:hypothetical protein
MFSSPTKVLLPWVVRMKYEIPWGAGRPVAFPLTTGKVLLERPYKFVSGCTRAKEARAHR